jgi:uncharacterized protein (TIGR02145 family)
MKKIIIGCLVIFLFSRPGISQVVPQGYLINNDIPTIIVGAQVWMKYNLDVSTYQDGTPIEGANIDFNRTTTTPAWCYYNHLSSYNETYGKLYNGYAIRASKNICPIGFRVPTQADFATLASTLGATNPGAKLKEVGSVHWTSNATSTDNYGFTALPGGYMGNGNSSSNINVQAYFWTSTPITGGGSTNYIRMLYNTNGNFTEANTFVLEGGVSVRCIRN